MENGKGKEEKSPDTKTQPEQKAPVSVRVYVGNLPYSCNWQRLKDHFKPCGNVVYADVLRDTDGKSKGCGIVEFENLEQAETAIKTLHNSKIDERQIFVREDRENHSGLRKVFIGNLPYSTSWQDLKDEFKKFGNVVRADILMERNGRSRGQGSVLFETEEAAEEAVKQLNNAKFQDRVITVRLWKF